ncbi:hypothetical protein MNV49_003204 [Pseudohyphozyma bogoriensis]|nr:hypothetical protein MNV49_003204 [Pseudohyphozyma bogoriensis]
MSSADVPVNTPAAPPKPAVAAADRPLTSCSECSRRKTKCDKLSPCGSCVKRGKTHLCRLPRKEKEAEEAAPMPTDFDNLCMSSFEEINSVRTAVDALRDRLGALENILAKAFEMAKPAVEAARSPSTSRAVFGSSVPTFNGREAANSPAVASGSGSGAEDDRMGEDVDASISLEFLALGRKRMFGQAADTDVAESTAAPPLTDPPSLNTNPSVPSPAATSPGSHISIASVQAYATPTALAAAAPSQAQSEALILHALEWTSWHHAAIYVQGFAKEHGEFWNMGEGRMELADPLWVLVAGLKHLTREQSSALGYQSHDVHILSKRWFDCSMASLTLINAGMATAQDMGLHRMATDEEWARSMEGRSETVRGRSLIDREIKKRAFYSLVAQDWFSIAYRNTYTIQPSQIKTPFPLNAHDSDLAAGRPIAQPLSSYTLVGTSLIWIKIARSLFHAFQHLQSDSPPSYKFLLEADHQLQAVIDSAPAWLLDGGPTENMPPPVHWIRHTFQMSSAHKVLTLHRPFLARAFRDKRYESSRSRAILASRKILREAESSCGSRLWTVPYHLSAAACVVALDLFQHISTTSPILDEERAEIRGALVALATMQDLSPIATRGVALITNLLDEEARLRQEQAIKMSVTAMNGHKRQRSADIEVHTEERSMSKMARLLNAVEEVSPPSGGSPSTSPFPFKRTDLPHPATPDALAASLQAYLPIPSPDQPGNFEFTADYMQVFRDSGFDPLQGALGQDLFTYPDDLSVVGFQHDQLFDGGAGAYTGWDIFNSVDQSTYPVMQ